MLQNLCIFLRLIGLLLLESKKYCQENCIILGLPKINLRMNKNKEDYLKALYQLGGQGEPVANKQIALRLQIAPASVTEMLARLGREGLIDYVPYKGSRLTDEGMRHCIDLVRSHRLWEVFLIRHLGYSWSEAHEEAHLLEHATPLRLTDRLERFLGFPEQCPHGETIPRHDCPDRPEALRALTSLGPGGVSVIRKVSEERELLDYLERHGIVVGGEVKVVSVEDYEGPFDLRVNGVPVRISHKAACQVFVDPAVNGQPPA